MKKGKKPKQREKTAKRSYLKRALLHEWLGSWVTNPKTDNDRRAASLARRSTKVTKSGSFISPVAVAAIDVLGMKSLLGAMPLEQVAQRVAEPFFDLDGPAYRFGRGMLTARQLERLGYRRMAAIYPATISDTIVLARRPDWELGDPAIAAANAVVELARYVCKVTKINSLYGVWLRSAISFGECLLTVAGRPVMLGAPTREASEWERCQEWVGGMLAPSAIETLRGGAVQAKQINGPDFIVRYPNVLVEYPIPVKVGSMPLPRPSIALNWTSAILPGAIMWEARLPAAPDPETTPLGVQQKIRNTIEFAKYCEDAPLESIFDWGA